MPPHAGAAIGAPADQCRMIGRQWLLAKRVASQRVGALTRLWRWDGRVDSRVVPPGRRVIVRCTKKMLDLLGGRSITLSELAPTDNDWYLNLLWIDRQKCILVTHAGTLFSADAGGLYRCDIDVLNQRLRRTLRNRGEYVRPFELVARRLTSRT